MLSRVVESAGGVKEAASEIREARELVTVQREAAIALKRDFEECGAISGAGPGMGSVSLKETFWELELALDSRGWQRMQALSALEFSRYGIGQLILMSRLYFIKNPLVKRGVLVKSYYTFGRGYEITAEDETLNQAIEAFLEANDAELGALGLTEKDQSLSTDGNLFFVFFSRTTDGETKVRTIDPVEMIDVVTNPDDASEPWYFKREWQAQTFEPQTGVIAQKPARGWYPAIGYEPTNKLKTIGGIEVFWDSPVYHVKTGGLPKWKWGCPETYATMDWARAYRRFLENWASITDALARFAMTVETKGGQQAIQAFSQALSTTLADGGTNIERNPSPNVASTFVGGPGTKLTPMRTAGATTEPEQGRRVMLMAAMADGLPETFYGDASTGSLATAQSLDRPTELQFLHRQERWTQILQTVIYYALSRSAGAPKGKLREASKPVPAKKLIRVEFPAILEHNIKESIEAIVAATTLNGDAPAHTIDIKTAARLLMRELGVENVDVVLDAMYPDATYDAEQPDPNEEPEPVPAGTAAPEPVVKEAVRQLLAAAHKLKSQAARA